MQKNELNPFSLFSDWYSEVQKIKEIIEPTAMNVATATKDGIPSNRMVLLKNFDERGFVFYTNLGSQKSKELMENPIASLCFHWMPLKKQVRILGKVEKVSDAEADEYFASRARTSQIGAWASKQSQTIEHPMDLEKRVVEFTAKFGLGKVPRPEFWSGYRVIPTRFEFWQDKTFRLHDRFIFEKDSNGQWQKQWIYP